MSKYQEIEDEIKAAEREFRPIRNSLNMRTRDYESESFECPTPITCQFPKCDCGPGAAETMANLRNSVIDERARRLYTLVTVAPEDEAIDIIRLALRVERDEGIAAGHDQAQRFSHLEIAS